MGVSGGDGDGPATGQLYDSGAGGDRGRRAGEPDGRDQPRLPRSRALSRAYQRVVHLADDHDQPPQVARIVERQMRRNRGDAVVNLRITGRGTYGDALAPLGVGVLAGGIYYFAVDNPDFSDVALIGAGLSLALSRRSFFVEGDVVRYR